MLGFNYQKAVQALNFFAISEGGEINKMKALKLIWLSDRLHLRRFGRPILNDTYFALSYGPVASNTKDLVEGTSFLTTPEKEYRDLYIENDNQYFYHSLNPIEKKVFSITDLEIMQSIFQEFGKFDQFSLSEESHKYPEWRKFVDHLEAGYTSRFEMNYEDFFSAFAEGENHLFKADEDYLEQSKAMFLENGYIYRLV